MGLGPFKNRWDLLKIKVEVGSWESLGFSRILAEFKMISNWNAESENFQNGYPLETLILNLALWVWNLEFDWCQCCRNQRWKYWDLINSDILSAMISSFTFSLINHLWVMGCKREMGLEPNYSPILFVTWLEAI